VTVLVLLASLYFSFIRLNVTFSVGHSRR
jgi:hypothetical protein